MPVSEIMGDNVDKYETRVRPAFVIYAINGGYLVQPVPSVDGYLMPKPYFARDEAAVSDAMLRYIGEVNLR